MFMCAPSELADINTILQLLPHLCQHPDHLSRLHPISTALSTVSPEEVEVRTPCPSHAPKRRNCKALGQVAWGARTSVAHHLVQHSQSNVVEDDHWGDCIPVHSNVVVHCLAAKWSLLPLCLQRIPFMLHCGTSFPYPKISNYAYWLCHIGEIWGR
jgi:hypothetical protein